MTRTLLTPHLIAHLGTVKSQWQGFLVLAPTGNVLGNQHIKTHTLAMRLCVQPALSEG